jgi:ribonuclease R
MQQIYKGIIAITSKKEGYVRLQEEGTPAELLQESIFISHDDLNTALHGDTVTVELLGKKADNVLFGKIISIEQRGKKAYAGVLEEDHGMYFLVPQDKRMYTDIIVPKDKAKHAEPGQKVVVALVSWNDAKKSPLGEVIAVLGRPGENDAEMLAYALERGFAGDHPDAVSEEASAIKSRGITEEDKAGRRDFRDTLVFTIDPADAKDFDDAISYKELPNGHLEVGIHIADVSFYVKPGSALDDEAIERETSVYLVDRVIPMLPEVLSNDLCSLVEAEDRLVMSAVFEIDDEGNIYSEWYGRALINSKKRFTYENAQESLDREGSLYHAELTRLNKLAKKLYEAKLAHGALVLETEEVKFKLDEKGVPVDVYIKHRGDTHKMIEELMLLANRKVSEFITKKQEEAQGEGKSICIYRVHDTPDPDKMHNLDLFIRSIGEHVKFIDGAIPSQDLNALLVRMEGKPEKELLQQNITRSMAKAVYSTKNIGHYGLAFDFYSHFTSPIRRYPDTLLHRLLARVLENDFPKEEERGYFNKLCLLASAREKDASDAERGSIKYKQVEYMSFRIGQTFEGTISGVSQSGIFVEEKKSKCEGMIRLRDLGEDFFVYDQKNSRVFGERTGIEFKIGNTVKIKVKETNLDIRAIDYILVA